MPKPTKHQKRAGSPKLQLGLGKGILKQSTLLDTPKKKTAPAAKPPPATAMDTSDDDDDDDDNGWPKLPTATPMDTQGTPPGQYNATYCRLHGHPDGSCRQG